MSKEANFSLDFAPLIIDLQSHGMVWVGRDLKDLLVQSPAMGRDTFH